MESKGEIKMNNIQTKNCIIQGCKNKAKYFTGHLHNGKTLIDAGFCEEHGHVAYNPHPSLNPIKNCWMPTGCFGKWHKHYGKELF